VCVEMPVSKPRLVPTILTKGFCVFPQVSLEEYWFSAWNRQQPFSCFVTFLTLCVTSIKMFRFRQKQILISCHVTDNDKCISGWQSELNLNTPSWCESSPFISFVIFSFVLFPLILLQLFSYGATTLVESWPFQQYPSIWGGPGLVLPIL